MQKIFILGIDQNLSDAELWSAKYKHDSAYHPETGEKMFVLGRMSCWVPSNMFITGGMLAFQATSAQLIGWQFANQSGD